MNYTSLFGFDANYMWWCYLIKVNIFFTKIWLLNKCFIFLFFSFGTKKFSGIWFPHKTLFMFRENLLFLRETNYVLMAPDLKLVCLYFVLCAGGNELGTKTTYMVHQTIHIYRHWYNTWNNMNIHVYMVHQTKDNRHVNRSQSSTTYNTERHTTPTPYT